MKLKTFLYIYFFIILQGISVGQSDNAYQSFVEGFKNPPLEAQPLVYHWWLGGDVDTNRLKEELKSFKEAGIAGFTIFEIGSRDTVRVKSGPAFLSGESLDLIKFAVEEAGKMGLEVGLNTASSWNAGGNWIPPQYAAKSIYYAQTMHDHHKNQPIKLPFPEVPKVDPWGKPGFIEFGKDGKPLFYEEIAVLAIPEGSPGTHLDTGRIIDVTRYFDSRTEMLDWQSPPGNWNIIRYICSNSGENLKLPSKNSAGPIMDHYDDEATEFHFTYILEKLESVLGDLEKTALKSLYMPGPPHCQKLLKRSMDMTLQNFSLSYSMNSHLIRN